LARSRRGTTSSIHVFQAGPAAWLAAQYSVAARKIQAVAGRPISQAATGMSNSAVACKLAQSTTHCLHDPVRCKNQGVASCSVAPTSMGSVATNPATVSPVPSAKANAEKYVSPMPTIKL